MWFGLCHIRSTGFESRPVRQQLGDLVRREGFPAECETLVVRRVRLLLASVLVVPAAPRAELKPATYVKSSVRQGRAGKLGWRLRPYDARPLHR
jgi:hypothetical protein